MRLTPEWEQEGSPTPVAPAQTSEITTYYEDKLTKIMGSSGALEEQIASLKDLRTQIDLLIEELLQKQQTIEASEFGQLVEEMEITPSSINAGEAKVPSIGKKINAKISEKTQVQIEAVNDKVVLRDSGAEATTTDITVSSEGVSTGGAQIKVSPSEAAQKVKATKKKISIAANNQKRAVYNVKGQTNAKILGILPVTMQRSIEIDAQNGNVLSDEKPWWAAVAVDDTAATEEAVVAEAAVAAEEKVAAEAAVAVEEKIAAENKVAAEATASN